MVLFAIGLFHFVVPTSKLTDLDPDDEIFNYIHGALGKTDLYPDWGPLYSLWYRFLLLFPLKSDPANLYYFNGSLLLFFLPLVYYLFMTMMRLPPPVVWISSFLLVLNPYFLLINRKPNHFALLVILLFFILAKRTGTRWGFLIFTSQGFLLGSFIRPEYFLSFILCSLVTFSSLIRNHRRFSWKQGMALSLLGLQFFLLVSLFGGTPLGRFGTKEGKAVLSFFDKNYERYQLDPGRVGAVGPHEFGKNLYKNPQNLWQAYTHNPGEFQKHLLFNFKEYFKTFALVFLSYFYLVKTPFFMAIVFLTIVYLRGPWGGDRRKGEGRSPGSPREFYFLAFLSVFPFQISGLIFGSLSQYFLSQIPFFIPLFLTFAWPIRNQGDPP